MLVDINLLPEKEKKNIALILVGVVLALVLVIGVSLQYSNINQKKLQITSLEQEIQLTQQLKVVEEKKLSSINNSTSLTQLETAVEWIGSYPLPTVYILDHLTSLLPERGFIMNFNLSDSGTVGLVCQFDTNRQAAYYLRALKESNLIETVDLSSLSTTEMNIEEALEEQDYIPRYVANFSISLDIIELKQAVQKDEG